MLTRDEILAIPALELAEVSARMMGWKCQRNQVFWMIPAPLEHDPDNWRARPKDEFKPDTDPRHAREVADWVCIQTPTDGWADGDTWRTQPMVYFIETRLSEVRSGNKFMHVHCWDYTPEQLTRAALLAFVDAGGEIE